MKNLEKIMNYYLKKQKNSNYHRISIPSKTINKILKMLYPNVNKVNLKIKSMKKTQKFSIYKKTSENYKTIRRIQNLDLKNHS